jgi:hypothetical protein
VGITLGRAFSLVWLLPSIVGWGCEIQHRLTGPVIGLGSSALHQGQRVVIIGYRAVLLAS